MKKCLISTHTLKASMGPLKADCPANTARTKPRQPRLPYATENSPRDEGFDPEPKLGNNCRIIERNLLAKSCQKAVQKGPDGILG